MSSVRPRSETARLLTREVSRRIADVAPAGLGHWPPAWELVAAPTDAVLDAIHEWEAAGDGTPREEELRRAVSAAADRALEAWREAARRWEAAGCPCATEQREASGVA